MVCHSKVFISSNVRGIENSQRGIKIFENCKNAIPVSSGNTFFRKMINKGENTNFFTHRTTSSRGVAIEYYVTRCIKRLK